MMFEPWLVRTVTGLSVLVFCKVIFWLIKLPCLVHVSPANDKWRLYERSAGLYDHFNFNRRAYSGFLGEGLDLGTLAGSGASFAVGVASIRNVIIRAVSMLSRDMDISYNDIGRAIFPPTLEFPQRLSDYMVGFHLCRRRLAYAKLYLIINRYASISTKPAASCSIFHLYVGKRTEPEQLYTVNFQNRKLSRYC
ncbi:hypothetical protein M501DRAFT_144619 [Patellaria atrata CBS 101060]|uniref:Uncharacterized protein n=1 Tax=Patellaria atrata CBS 101060 TaxID=1346257 RepID=A0A9P4S8K2_9PEZI|nr:hypothetical protein M501DRAFT_144619 [Patellaria atrata CBS 101060]